MAELLEGLFLLSQSHHGRIMTKHLDILMERLKHYDEVTLLELLDIDAEDLLERFKDKVISRRDYLAGEVELLEETDEDMVDELEGFEIEQYDE